LIFFSGFSSEIADIVVSEDSVGESEELFLVDNSWVLGVDSLSSLLNPSPVLIGWGVVKSMGKILKSGFNLIVIEGDIMIGIEILELLVRLSSGNARTSDFGLFLSFHFFSKIAEIEMLEDSVGEFPEFSSIDMSWVLGVNFLSGFFNPFPLISRECMVEGFSELLDSDFDLIV
jgi:hypothetical protein